MCGKLPVIFWHTLPRILGGLVMSTIRRGLCKLILLATLLGWVMYPGWYYEWYSNWPEKYAWPASFSNSFDPHWGFWFW